jgi:hypothetical protein
MPEKSPPSQNRVGQGQPTTAPNLHQLEARTQDECVSDLTVTFKPDT